MNLKRVAVGALVAAIAPMLSGCVALALAPLAPMIGGTVIDNKAEVVIDQATVSERLKVSLAQAKTLALVGSDDGYSYIGELLETSGGYTVSIDRDGRKAATMTPSERRTALELACKGGRGEIALTFGNDQTEATSGALMGGLVTGRAKTANSTTMEVRHCKEGWTQQVRGTLNLDMGIYQTQSSTGQVVRMAAKATAEAILRIAGKTAIAAKT